MYEDNIEEWYKKQRDNVSLTDFLCEQVILKEEEKGWFGFFILVLALGQTRSDLFWSLNV
jgi:hypothetical protein